MSPDFRQILETALECEVRPSQPLGPEPEADDWFHVQVEDRVLHLAVEVRSSIGTAIPRLRERQDELRARWPDVIPILAVPRLSKRERDALRADRVNHMDLAGNVWIRSPGLLVNTEGARPSVTSRPSKGRNPFSKKASLVARVLLAHPSTHWRVRDIAAEASLSVGYSSEILRSLVERGHAIETPDGFRLEDPVALLIEWVGVYRWEDNRIHSFVAPLPKDELVHEVCTVLRAEDVECLLTLLSAIDQIIEYVEHDQTHLYVSSLTPTVHEALRSQVYAETVPRGGNLHLMEPYYGPAVRYGAVAVDSVRSVSDVQLFLDLVHYPVRGPEAASALLRSRLGAQLGLTADQVAVLSRQVGL
jgi:hypothetical protein